MGTTSKDIEDEATILIGLGLTPSEAKVYLSLLQRDTSCIAYIANVTGIFRENLYHIVRTLEEKGLIEKEIGSPTAYRAVSPKNSLPMLIRNKKAQITELETRAKTIIEKYKAKQLMMQAFKIHTKEDIQFVIVPGKDTIVQRLHQALEKAQVSVDTVTSQKRFSRAIIEFAEGYKRALKRGVKIRLTTEKHVPEKEALETLTALTKNPNFEVKYFPEHPKAVVAIFDGREAHFILSATAHLEGASGLWSKNSSFVAIVQSYFDSKWNNDTTLKTQKPS